jgi:zinc protease
MIWRTFVALATILALAAPGLAQGKGKPQKGKTPAKLAPGPASGGLKGLPKLETWTLDNGLQVAYMAMHKAPVVTVQVWYHAGAKEERRDRRGSAHMFEHMMFKGTKNVRPEEHARHMNRLGGYVNAFTTEDVTAYHNTLPKEYLDFAVKLEAERMRNLLFRDDMIKTEREVVKEEIRQQENNPVVKGFLRFLEITFTKHPYAWTAGGALKDLDATTPEDLKKFYDTYYIPNNAMLVVVGDVDKSAVEAAATKWFAPIPKGAEPPRPANASPEPKQTKMRRETVDPSQIGFVIGGYHIPEAKHSDIYALQVLQLILAQGESSRMHRRLVRDDKVALQAGGQAIVREHPGLFLIFGAFLEAAQGPKVEAALLDELEKAKKNPPTGKELKKAKNQIQASFVMGLRGVTGLASQIGNSWIQTGDPGAFITDLDKYAAVSAADIKRVAKTYLTENNLTLVLIPPRGADAKAKKGGAK